MSTEPSRYASIFNTLPDGAGTTRIADGRYLEVNPAFERILGYGRDELVGRTSLELGIWADAGERGKLLAEFARHGQVDRLALVARAKDGSLIPGQMSARYTRIGDEDCFVFVFRDLRHEMQVESELELSKAALDAAGRMGRLGAWVAYYGGIKEDYWSPICRDIAGISADEPVPQNFAERFVLPAYRGPLREAERRCREQFVGWDIELEIQRTDGQRRWMRVMGEPVVEQGQLHCIRGLMQDTDASHRNLERLRHSEDKFSRFFELLPEAMAIIQRPGGAIVDVNPAWEALTGFTRGEAVGSDSVTLGLLSAQQREGLRQQTTRHGGVVGREIELRARNGERRVVLMSTSALEVDGQACWIMMHSDITEQRKAQEQAQQREQQLSLTAAAARLGMWDWNIANGTVAGDGRWRELHCLRPDEGEITQERLLSILAPEERERSVAEARLQRGRDQAIDLVVQLPHPDGQPRWVREVGKVVAHAADGTAQRMLGVTMDVTEQRQQQARLQHLAHFDALTGLPNRVLLADRMKQAMAQAERTGQLLGVVYLDVDGFKAVNDRLGHSAGDQLLREIAQRLPQVLRAADSVARLGGDEFVLLLAALTSEHDCVLAIKRAMAAICAPCHVGGVEVIVSASMGASIYPDDPSDADTLLRHADQAMYTAKQAGRNRYHFFDAGQAHAARSRVERIAELRHAMQDGEFVLHLQPRVNMQTRQVVGAEALARWQHPEQGLLSPAHFLPDIEGSELDVEFGDWVISAALSLLQRWQRQGLPLSLSINITASHLQSVDFLHKLSGRLHPSLGLMKDRLEFEITESGSLSNLDASVAVIDQLHQMGFQVSLDDFGTGYSSLTYLRRLPVDTLKIDQSFVRDMQHNPNDRAIVRGVIGLAHSFGRGVIAEGVETAQQGAMLLEMGCEMGQGYGIARPMPEGAFQGWMARWKDDPAWRAI